MNKGDIVFSEKESIHVKLVTLKATDPDTGRITEDLLHAITSNGSKCIVLKSEINPIDEQEKLDEMKNLEKELDEKADYRTKVSFHYYLKTILNKGEEYFPDLFNESELKNIRSSMSHEFRIDTLTKHEGIDNEDWHNGFVRYKPNPKAKSFIREIEAFLNEKYMQDD